MTKSEARHLAEVLNAWADGRQIQFYSGFSVWEDLRKPDWFPHPFDKYRIKPEPIKSDPREFWVNPGNNWLLSEGESPLEYDIEEQGWIKVREVIE